MPSMAASWYWSGFSESNFRAHFSPCGVMAMISVKVPPRSMKNDHCLFELHWFDIKGAMCELVAALGYQKILKFDIYTMSLTDRRFTGKGIQCLYGASWQVVLQG